MTTHSYQYLAHGNPPVNPGIFRTLPGQRRSGERIAFWPASVKPTFERVANITRLWEARVEESPGFVFQPDEVRRELCAAGLLDEGGARP